MSLKVVSYNIHKGQGPTGFSQNLKAIKELLKNLQPDIAFLQEVVGDHKNAKFRAEEWSNHAQFEYLADEFWPHYAYGKNAVYDQGNHGNCILSKYPIRQWRNIDISTNHLEKRGLLHISIEIPKQNKIIELLDVHLNLLQHSRRKQIFKIIDYINQNIDTKSALILAGDFNDWQNKATEELNKKLGLREIHLELKGRLKKTFPSHYPVLKLDRIYFKNLTPIATDLSSLKSSYRDSDHIPVLGHFEF